MDYSFKHYFFKFIDLSTVTGKMVSVKSFCLTASGEEKLVFYIGLKIK